MPGRKSLKRLKSYGYGEYLSSLYLWIPAIIAGALFFTNSTYFSIYERIQFVELATQASQALIAITLTGLAILVSFSDRDFLVYFNNHGDFDALLFIFEYVVVLSIITTIGGILIQTSDAGINIFYLYFFLFFHTILSVLSLISTIMRYAESKANFDAISDLDEDEIPDQMKEDLKDILAKETDQAEGEDESDEQI